MMEISEEFKVIKNTFGSTSKACEIISNTNKEVKNLVENVIPDLEKNIDNKSINKNQIEMDILSEVEERLLKRKNVVLYGLEDKNDIQNDFKYISNILATTGIIIDISKFSRLGKFDDKAVKPRPLLLKLNDVKEVESVLKNKKKLF